MNLLDSGGWLFIFTLFFLWPSLLLHKCLLGINRFCSVSWRYPLSKLLKQGIKYRFMLELSHWFLYRLNRHMKQGALVVFILETCPELVCGSGGGGWLGCRWRAGGCLQVAGTVPNVLKNNSGQGCWLRGTFQWVQKQCPVTRLDIQLPLHVRCPAGFSFRNALGTLQYMQQTIFYCGQRSELQKQSKNSISIVMQRHCFNCFNIKYPFYYVFSELHRGAPVFSQVSRARFGCGCSTRAAPPELCMGWSSALQLWALQKLCTFKIVFCLSWKTWRGFALWSYEVRSEEKKGKKKVNKTHSKLWEEKRFRAHLVFNETAKLWLINK